MIYTGAVESELENARLVAGEVRELLAMPEVYLKVQALVNDYEATLDDFTEVVQADPGITSRILQMANSAFFGYGRKVDSIPFAINLMGISQLHDLVLATSVTSAFSALPGADIDFSRFWRESIHTGILARLLANERGLRDSERLFVAGLLHNVGHLILNLRRPVSLQDAQDAALVEQQPLYEAERDRLGFHYGDVGAAWMECWLFPDSLVCACRQHCEPLLDRDYPTESAIVHVARSLVAAKGEPDQGPAGEPAAAALGALEIGPERLAELDGEAETFLAELVTVLMGRRNA